MRAKLTEKVESVAKNGKNYHKITLRSMEDGDKTFSLFNGMGEKLEEGKWYEYTTTQNGKWTNIASINLLEEQPKAEEEQKLLPKKEEVEHGDVMTALLEHHKRLLKLEAALADYLKSVQ